MVASLGGGDIRVCSRVGQPVQVLPDYQIVMVQIYRKSCPIYTTFTFLYVHLGIAILLLTGNRW
jgi:hypothetical protein